MKRHTQIQTPFFLSLLFLIIFSFPVYAAKPDFSEEIPLNGSVLNFDDPRGPFDYTTEILNYKSRDNASIEATLVLPKTDSPKSGIVFVHMWARDRMTFWGLPEYLATYGYPSIYMDLRGHGKSSFPNSSVKVTPRDKNKSYRDFYLDIIPAFKILNEQKTVRKDHLILLGASLGCPLGVKAAQEFKNSIAGMIFLAPSIDYFDVNCFSALNTLLKKPAYVIAEKSDRSYRSALHFFDQFEGYKTLLRLTNVGHGTDILYKNLKFPTLLREWVDQIDQNSAFFQKLSDDKSKDKG